MRQAPPKESEICDVYIDESSHTNHRYLVLGSIVIPKPNVAQFVKMIWDARGSNLPPGSEMKWTKVSPSKLAAYMRVVDVFFAIGDEAHFHALVVDTTKQKHAVYNQGSREIGFNKELYQLAMKCRRLYTHLFHVYPDQRSTDHDPEELRLILNRGARTKGDKRDWPFRRVQFRDSKKTEPLQIADIFAGAIAFRLNGHDRVSGASQAKAELSKHIFAKASVRDIWKGTLAHGKFTVWHRQLK